MELAAECRHFYRVEKSKFATRLVGLLLLLCSSSAEVPQSVFHSCILADYETSLCLSTGVFRALQYGFMKATVSESLLDNGLLEHTPKKKCLFLCRTVLNTNKLF